MARPHHRRKWSTPGPPNPETTTTARTDAAACAATTPKSSGATPKKWDAQWREAEAARFGFATMIRQATGPASGPIELPPPPNVWHAAVTTSLIHARTIRSQDQDRGVCVYRARHSCGLSDQPAVVTQ